MKKFQIVWKGQRFPDWLKKLLDTLEIFQTHWTFKMYFFLYYYWTISKYSQKTQNTLKLFKPKQKIAIQILSGFFLYSGKPPFTGKKSFWKNWKFSRHNGIIVKCECNWGDWSLNQLLNEWMTTVLVKLVKLVKHPMALPQSAGKNKG